VGSTKKISELRFPKRVTRPASGTNSADLGPVAFCMAVRISSSVKPSHGSTSCKGSSNWIIIRQELALKKWLEPHDH